MFLPQSISCKIKLKVVSAGKSTVYTPRVAYFQITTYNNYKHLSSNYPSKGWKILKFSH